MKKLSMVMNMNVRIMWVLVGFAAGIILPNRVLGQNSDRRIMVRYIQNALTIDGKLDEPEWQTADVGNHFRQFFPSDSVESINPTEFRLLYNDHTLYIGIRAEAKSDRYVVSSLRRDFRGTSNDNVTLMFDTYKDGTNAFLFGMTPYGVQREAFISEGGSSRTGFNITWDQKWQLASTMYEDYYVLEAAIPFSSLRFREGATSWRVQCYRWDMQTNEQSAWAPVPQNQMLSSLAFMGEMVFEKPLGKSHTPLTLIPYLNALADKDYHTNIGDEHLRMGADAKIAIGNSLNLDLTVNPDFSNVEVDDIFTNLTRFEVLLPEKRQFFIENNDLFGNYGSIYRDEYPFFSRRIGLARDTAGNQIENRILGGVRLSGKINDDWRVGFLNMQTDEDMANEIPSNNNMMISVQRKMFSRSSIGFFAVNRQVFKDYEFLSPEDKYNRVIGVDYNLASADNVWTGKFYVHKSLQPGDYTGNFSSQATVTYNQRNIRLITDLVYVDEDFRADLGYVPRTNILKSGNGITLNFYPRKGSISRHGPQAMALLFWQPGLDFRQTDHTYRLSYGINFNNQSEFQFSLDNQYIFLTWGFDPARKASGTPLPGNQGYTFNQVSARYQSNPAKVFAFNAQLEGGEFFNGYTTGLRMEMTARIQPWANMNLAVNYDRIDLPDPYSDAGYWLVTPRIDVTFSRSLFWSTLVQYSNQRDNLGINSRLQWRFAPLSDLYLVYNDNYTPTVWAPKFRSINLKVTYWLNI